MAEKPWHRHNTFAFTLRILKPFMSAPSYVVIWCLLRECHTQTCSASDVSWMTLGWGLDFSKSLGLIIYLGVARYWTCKQVGLDSSFSSVNSAFFSKLLATHRPRQSPGGSSQWLSMLVWCCCSWSTSRHICRRFWLLLIEPQLGDTGNDEQWWLIWRTIINQYKAELSLGWFGNHRFLRTQTSDTLLYINLFLLFHRQSMNNIDIHSTDHAQVLLSDIFSDEEVVQTSDIAGEIHYEVILVNRWVPYRMTS